MKSVVLERQGLIRVRVMEFSEVVGERDVRIRVRSVGICGSDVHYYSHGKIGP